MHRYEAIKSEGVKASVPDIIEGSGMGRKTIDAICSEKGLSLDNVLAKLKQKGMKPIPMISSRTWQTNLRKAPWRSLL